MVQARRIQLLLVSGHIIRADCDYFLQHDTLLDFN